ncbi:chitin deacetylase 1 [Colletotrichum fioriniae PJ7]|uniref:Chitin deacetylase 1 n=1 Tax=Colletotrichum fioriniae PJ7 TaxID=1445577 RepID=A0A010Q340_9PEZI|nr:chitin deacetylase 1 [Colletotrichum fioriniae PJ7]
MVHVEESLQIPRDFEGFGEDGFDPKWPNGARIAVSFVLNYEEGGERSTLDGDPFSEPYLWEKGASGGYKEGARYLNAEQDFEYGSRSASWRLIRLFKEFGWSFTTYAVAYALKRNPTFAKALVRDGHEIACHGLRWLDIWNYSLEEDKEYVKQNILMLKEVSGEMPVGAYFGRGTPNTPSLFPEVWKSLGGEFLWSSECYNDDVPYWLDLPWEKELPEEKREGMLLIPYNYDCNDGKFHMSPGFGSSVAETYEQYLKNTFDCLYREGGKLMNIPLHTRIIGKPGRSEALRKFMKYIAEKEGVWVTTRRDIAKHMRTDFPYKPNREWMKVPTTDSIQATSANLRRIRQCDDQFPACSNCRKSGAQCDKADVADDAPSTAYTRALEERVAFLENKLAQVPIPEATETPRETASNYSVSSGRDKNALSDVVAHVSLGNFEAPAYVGPSSGLSLALNLGEMVQATVWNKMLPDIQDGTAGNQANCINPSPRCITVEDLLAHSVKEPPSDEQGSQMLKAYTSQLHSKYPFLEPEELWKLHGERLTLAAKPIQTLTRVERFGIFKLYLVYAMGATLVQLTQRGPVLSPEALYITALQHISAARESRTVQNIEAMTLLVMFHLRSTSSHGLWYMIGLAMRTSIDLGLHRAAHEQNLDDPLVQRRRRLFWSVYSLERTIAVSLGRPLSIADNQIDVELPNSIINGSPSASIIVGNDITLALVLFKLRRIESKIHHSVYRTDKTLDALRPKLDRLHQKLKFWRDSLTDWIPAGHPDLNYALLLYNRALRLLIQPFLPILPGTDPFYGLCMRAAGDICQAHKRLHQTLDYGHSFIAVQTVFVAGVTLVYGIWTQGNALWSVAVSNDIRACSLVLFVMSERAPWVRRYRDAFEVLVNAAMEKLQDNETGLADMASAQMRAGKASSATESCGIQNPGLSGNETTTRPGDSSSNQFLMSDDGGIAVGEFEGAWPMVAELANWIDQDTEGGSPVWMPNFELLQSLSGTCNE